MYTLKYKEMAKDQMRGNMHTLIGGWILCGIIFSLLNYPVSLLVDTIEYPIPESSLLLLIVEYVVSVILSLPVTFLTGALWLGLAKIHLDLSNDVESELGDLFSQMSFFVSGGMLSVFWNIFFLTGMLFFIFPAIYVFYALSMAPYIFVEQYMSPFEAIIESNRIMNGHKMDLFKLHLNFFLWHLLGIVTCGIAYIYVIPYIYQAEANFYNDIK